MFNIDDDAHIEEMDRKLKETDRHIGILERIIFCFNLHVLDWIL